MFKKRTCASAMVAAALLLTTGSGVLAFGPKQDKSRFDELNIPDPSLVTDVASAPVEALPAGNGVRAGWARFSGEKRGPWRVQIDARSGAPLLVEGPGMRWPVAVPEGMPVSEQALRELEASFRSFVAENRDLLLARDDELVLDREASGPFGVRGFQVAFQRQVNGVVVEGDRYVFNLGYGSLVSFGTSRWTQVNVATKPDLTAETALETMADYMGLSGLSGVRVMAAPVLRIVPERIEGGAPLSSVYAGEIGRGYTSHLVWRIVLEVDEEPGIWVGMVDAHDGTMRAFFDDVRYAQVKGGVHPESPDGICPSGCEQPNWPMPFANVSIGGAPAVTGNAYGVFNCTPTGSTAVTQLQSPTIRISDGCGAVSESSVCGADIQLSVNSGTNCTVPAGHSAGDTKASRSCFYTGNRLKEHARAWIASNTWLYTTQTQINSNVNSTCNATWGGGQLNMYRAGNGCNNTCEIAGVVQHEWGHGMDQNDGGGFDNTSEGYADISEFLADHTSCIGRGFYQSGTCSGYGDTCLTCTGIRDMDWNARTLHTPAKMTGTLIGGCGGGGGPCGKEVHCEAYLAGEAVYDLAVRDLPAAGFDQATAWQIVDRIWYTSRTGSGGNMYTCTAGSGGCGATSLYQRLRTADDDDGNLANGTPHAAAIFAAFARHDIACGAAGDAANQSTSFPPVLTSLSLSGTGSTNSAILTINHTPNPASFRILRNDISCNSAFTIVGTAAGSATAYTDTGLPNGMPIYYRVQGVGANPAQESAVSNCVTVTPQDCVSTAPSLITPLDAATGIPLAPTLDWSDVSGAVSYDVQVATDAAFTNVVRSNSPTASTWVVSPALANDTTYYWRARANIACGPGPWSGSRSFLTVEAGYVDCGAGCVNLTPGRTVTYSGLWNAGTNPASKLIDGLTGTNPLCEGTPGFCAIASDSVQGQGVGNYFQIDLGAVKSVKSVTVFGRRDFAQTQGQNLLLKLSQNGTTWTTYPMPDTTMAGGLTVSTGRLARYVKVETTTVVYLSLYEVIVTGFCDAGGGPEVCDGDDDNCDGLVDGSCGLTTTTCPTQSATVNFPSGTSSQLLCLFSNLCTSAKCDAWCRGTNVQSGCNGDTGVCLGGTKAFYTSGTLQTACVGSNPSVCRCSCQANGATYVAETSTPCTTCGNGICEPDSGEWCDSCPSDCPLTTIDLPSHQCVICDRTGETRCGPGMSQWCCY